MNKSESEIFEAFKKFYELEYNPELKKGIERFEYNLLYRTITFFFNDKIYPNVILSYNCMTHEFSDPSVYDYRFSKIKQNRIRRILSNLETIWLKSERL